MLSSRFVLVVLIGIEFLSYLCDIEEHIDNPRDYADNLDAREYDPRLRAPCNEQNEISVDWGNAMKLYIASEGRGIDTSG